MNLECHLNPRKMSGVGLIEILIGITMSLLLMAGFINLFLNNKRAYLLDHNLSEIQRNGQFAHMILNRTMRLAGYRTMPDLANMEGFQEYVDIFPNGSELITGTDNITNGSDSITIRYQGNNSSDIYDCLATPVGSNELAESQFFINTNNELVCSATNNGVANPNNPAVLIENVEAMQIRYGEDTDADGIVNQYVPANFPGLDYNNVLAVRISLLLKTDSEVNPVLDSKLYNVQDVEFGPFNDNFLRKVYTTTIQLRSMFNDA
jgi:type IV pilus assembly protein PilW